MKTVKSINKIALFIMIMLVLTGCGGAGAETSGSGLGATEGGSTADSGVTAETTDGFSKESDYIFVTVDQIKSFFTTAELTTDNWSDYLEFRDVENNEVDAWGDVVSYRSDCTLCTKTGVTGKVEDLAMRVSYTQPYITNYYDVETLELGPTEENATYSGEEDLQYIGATLGYCTYLKGDVISRVDGDFIREDIRPIESIEVIKIKGTITQCDIPEELWNTNEGGVRFLAAHNNDELVLYYEDGHMEFFSENSSWESFAFDPSPFSWDLD